MQQGSFSHLPPFLKIVSLIILVLIGSLFASLITLLVAQPIFNVDVFSMESMEANIAFMRAMQIVQSILVFVLPSAFAAYLLYDNTTEVIPGIGRFERLPMLLLLIFAFAVIFLGQGFIAWTAWLNQQLQLPEAFNAINEWIQATEEQAMRLTKLMLQSSSWPTALITLFMIAVLPAIGEEWLFRGLIQKELVNIFKNVHVAIIVTAILFSAVHLQFMTFLPRVALGLILGYLMVFTNNIWIPIAAHFFNNFLAVAVYWFYSDEALKEELSGVAMDKPDLIAGFISLAAIFAFLYGTWRIGRFYNTTSAQSIK